MTLIISQIGKKAQKVDKTIFEKENHLQRYIHDNPESLPLYDIKDDIKLLIVAREFQTNSGPIDAIGFDRDGEIYIIETKLYKNSDKRTVVAQVLDYGAALAFNYTDFNLFLNELDAKVRQHFKTSIQQKINDFFEFEEEESKIFFEDIRTNFLEGKYRFVVLMDKLESRLRDLIRYINQNSQFDIYAVEIEYYQFENYEIVIPKLYGAEIKKEVSSSHTNNRKKWDETSFFSEAKNNLSENNFISLRKVFDFSIEKTAKIKWGSGNENG